MVSNNIPDYALLHPGYNRKQKAFAIFAPLRPLRLLTLLKRRLCDSLTK
jgi:hypothetical protein